MPLKLFGYTVRQSQRIAVTRDENDAREFVSSIEDIGPKGICITIPLHNQVAMEIRRGESIYLKVPMFSFVMEFYSRVTSFRADNIPLLVIEYPAEYKRVQRRNSVRLKILMDIQIAALPENPGEEPVFTGATALDISAGGLEILVPAPYEKDTVLLAKFDLPVDKKTVHNFLLKSKVRRVIPVTHRKYKLGLQFLELTRSDTDKIFQYIFKKSAEKNLWKK